MVVGTLEVTLASNATPVSLLSDFFRTALADALEVPKEVFLRVDVSAADRRRLEAGAFQVPRRLSRGTYAVAYEMGLTPSLDAEEIMDRARLLTTTSSQEQLRFIQTLRDLGFQTQTNLSVEEMTLVMAPRLFKGGPVPVS